MLSRIIRPGVPVLALALLGACTSLGGIRSAEVQPGASLAVQATYTSPPGDDAAWFSSYDCALDCNRAIPGGEVGVAYGTAYGATPVSIGAGVSGVFPFVEGYAQLNRAGGNPWGAGARIGIPVSGWAGHQLFARYDRPLAGGNRLLLSPALYLHAGHSPNGQNPGHMLGFVQAVGIELRGDDYSVTPGLSLAALRGEREVRLGGEGGVFTTAFATASISVVFHRKRTPAPE